MSREIRRVPVDFAWPLRTVWEGYLSPDSLREEKCPDCSNGYAPFAEYLYQMWYGNAPFDPRSTASTPLTAESPAARAFAERNIAHSPDYYGTSESDIVAEAWRLAGLWNGMWCHHLSQNDVDALLAADRLREFTHTWTRGVGWQVKSPVYRPTAAEVNEWSLHAVAFGGSDAGPCIRARCAHEGQPEKCPTCEGYGSLEAYPGQRAEAEAWERTEPPTGDGWQVWETTSEGSPISPVFADRADLISFLMSDQYFGFGTSPTPLTREQAEAFVTAEHSIGSMVMVGAQMIPGDAAVHELANRQDND